MQDTPVEVLERLKAYLQKEISHAQWHLARSHDELNGVAYESEKDALEGVMDEINEAMKALQVAHAHRPTVLHSHGNPKLCSCRGLEMSVGADITI